MTTVKADYGYEKVEAGGVTTLRIRRNRSAVTGAARACAAMFIVAAFLIAWVINNGRMTGPMTGWAVLASLGALVVAAMFSMGKKFTEVSLRGDRLTLASGDYAKKDICDVLIREMDRKAVSAPNAQALAARLEFQEVLALEGFRVTFNYGARTIVLADKLTGPQANHVGSEIQGWLTA